MKKCDFCTMSSPDGKCFWLSQVNRQDDCKKAIKQMAGALGSRTDDKNILLKRKDIIK